VIDTQREVWKSRVGGRGIDRKMMALKTVVVNGSKKIPFPF
jgi:hypothetical protein